jgi:hypothetical protein
MFCINGQRALISGSVDTSHIHAKNDASNGEKAPRETTAVDIPGDRTWAMDPGFNSWVSTDPPSSVTVLRALACRVLDQVKVGRPYSVRYLLTVLRMDTPPEVGDPSLTGAAAVVAAAGAADVVTTTTGAGVGVGVTATTTGVSTKTVAGVSTTAAGVVDVEVGGGGGGGVEEVEVVELLEEVVVVCA